jgi:hypothetical protein
MGENGPPYTTPDKSLTQRLPLRTHIRARAQEVPRSPASSASRPTDRAGRYGENRAARGGSREIAGRRGSRELPPRVRAREKVRCLRSPASSAARPTDRAGPGAEACEQSKDFLRARAHTYVRRGERSIPDFSRPSMHGPVFPVPVPMPSYWYRIPSPSSPAAAGRAGRARGAPRPRPWLRPSQRRG